MKGRTSPLPNTSNSQSGEINWTATELRLWLCFFNHLNNLDLSHESLWPSFKLQRRGLDPCHWSRSSKTPLTPYSFHFCCTFFFNQTTWNNDSKTIIEYHWKWVSFAPFNTSPLVWVVHKSSTYAFQLFHSITIKRLSDGKLLFNSVASKALWWFILIQ